MAAEGAATDVETPAPPPAYAILRFDENYSAMANPANRCDWSDPIKYIPLPTGMPSSYLTLGGEVRERFEGQNNLDFGLAGGASNEWLQRITLLTDWHLGPKIRFFVEGISGKISGQRGPAPAVQDDPLDLQCAFVEITPYEESDGKLALRAGRFGLSLGSGRLVATRAAPNIPFRFDGFEALYTRPAWAVTTFVTRPAKDDGKFDGADYSTAFWGAYATHWFDAPHTLGLDLYYLGIRNQHGAYASGHGDERRHSIGTRAFGQRDRWDVNAEAVWQWGTFGHESIRAWTASIDSGYTLDAPFKPRLGAKLDVTSGDRHPGQGTQGTFDALYFKSGYFNDASLLRPENIIDAHPNLAFKLPRSISLDGGVDFLWRYSRSDAVYAVPGFVAIPALKSAPNYVGTAYDVNATWQIQRHLTFQVSYVYFATGDYVHEAGGRDVNYASATMDFLF
jgi:hypothetical protein